MTTSEDYSKKTVVELKTLCKERNIKGYSGKKKEDIINALRKYDAAEAAPTVALTTTAPRTRAPKTTDQIVIVPADILLFFSSAKGEGRGNNDINNKKRELILKDLLFKEIPTDPEYERYWTLLKTSFEELCLKLKDSFPTTIEHKAGRAHNHDFLFKYSDDTLITVEFKYGAKKISNLPQFYQISTKSLFLPGFAETYYDDVVSKNTLYSDLGAIPTKEDYMKEIYKTESKVSFFIEAKDREKDKEYYRKKQTLANDFIKEWLKKHYRILDLTLLTRLFKEKQSDKKYILWDRDSWNIDEFKDDDLKLEGIVGLNDAGNSIIVRAKSGREFHMLLRWKNGIGILNPAWQISVR